MLIVLAICTRHRNAFLQQTLDSISKAEAAPSDSDVVVMVVDNDEKGGGKSVIEGLKGRFPYSLCYTQEKTQGIPFARNHAIEQALALKASAMIFIDDDEVVRPDWLRLLIERYLLRQQQGVAVIQGPVYPKFINNPPDWLPVELFSTPHQHKTGKQMRSAATNNVIFNLSLCTQGELRLDERMQYCGSSDTLFFAQAHDQGFVIEWYSDAVVDEWIPPERMTAEWLCMRYFRYGSSNVYAAYLKQGYRKTLKLFIKKCVNHFKQAWRLFSFTDKKSRIRSKIKFMHGLGVMLGLLGFVYNEYGARKNKISMMFNIKDIFKKSPSSSEPLVSIILPFFNNENTLVECLESVVRQTLTNIEIICIDDASTDIGANTVKKIMQADNRLHLIQLEKNSGVSAARNAGIRSAKGDYVFFIDADDALFDKNSLKHLYKIAKKNKADEVIGSCYKWRPDSNAYFLHSPVRGKGRDIKNTTFKDEPKLLSNTEVWNKLIKRSFLKKNGILFFNEEIKFFEDNPYAWKIHLLAKNICVSKKPTYLFRQPSGEDSYFSEKLLPRIEWHHLAFREIQHFFNGASPEIQNQRAMVESRGANLFLRVVCSDEFINYYPSKKAQEISNNYASLFGALMPESFNKLPEAIRKNLSGLSGENYAEALRQIKAMADENDKHKKTDPNKLRLKKVPAREKRF